VAVEGLEEGVDGVAGRRLGGSALRLPERDERGPADQAAKSATAGTHESESSSPWSRRPAVRKAAPSIIPLLRSTYQGVPSQRAVAFPLSSGKDCLPG